MYMDDFASPTDNEATCHWCEPTYQYHAPQVTVYFAQCDLLEVMGQTVRVYELLSSDVLSSFDFLSQTDK